MDLFLVVLGGRIKGCNIELHDVRWVVGETIEDTISDLKQQWIGQRKGLHIDSYRRIRFADGHHVAVNLKPAATNPAKDKLWFVNLGAYDPSDMAERHRFGFVVARSPQAAKARAKRLWLKGLNSVHKDDLHPVEGQTAIDDLLPIEGTRRWSVDLKPMETMERENEKPDWYGYRLI